MNVLIVVGGVEGADELQAEELLEDVRAADLVIAFRDVLGTEAEVLSAPVPASQCRVKVVDAPPPQRRRRS